MSSEIKTRSQREVLTSFPSERSSSWQIYPQREEMTDTEPSLTESRLLYLGLSTQWLDLNVSPKPWILRLVWICFIIGSGLRGRGHWHSGTWRHKLILVKVYSFICFHLVPSMCCVYDLYPYCLWFVYTYYSLPLLSSAWCSQPVYSFFSCLLKAKALWETQVGSVFLFNVLCS